MTLTDDDILAVASEHCEFTPEGTYHLRKYPGRWAIVAVVRECIQRASLATQTGTATGRKDGCEACAAIPASSQSNEKNAASVGGASAQVQAADAFGLCEPVAWRREWDGDVSDEGHWLYSEDEKEPQDGHKWHPLFVRPPTEEEIRAGLELFRQIAAGVPPVPQASDGGER